VNVSMTSSSLLYSALVDQDLAHEIVGDAGDELHLMRRHEHLDLVHRELGPPAHEPLGIAKRRVH
jgi:hypothetical protein